MPPHTPQPLEGFSKAAASGRGFAKKLWLLLKGGGDRARVYDPDSMGFQSVGTLLPRTPSPNPLKGY